MESADGNKRVIQRFLQVVWESGDLSALGDFWTNDCTNHAAPGPNNHGLANLRTYHESFLPVTAALAPVRLDVVQQVAETDRVVTHVVSHGQHTGPAFGIAPTGRPVSLATIRIDRMVNGRIAEHWSVADLAGLMQQLRR